MLCKLTGDPGPVQNHQPTGAGHGVTFEALAPSIRLWTPDFGAKSGRERTANGGFGVGWNLPSAQTKGPEAWARVRLGAPCNLQP